MNMNMHKLETIALIGIVVLIVVLIFGGVLIDITLKDFNKVEATEEQSDNNMEPMLSDIALERAVSVSEPLREEFVIEPIVGAAIIEEEPEMIMEIVEVVEAIEYFDIPLNEDLQDHIYKQCEITGVDASVVFAIIQQESNFMIDAVGDEGRALGLMQIHPRWNMERMGELNCWDLMDPYQNITVGIDIVADLAADGDPIEWVLMAYNGGEAYADRKVAAGEISDYATSVLNRAKEF